MWATRVDNDRTRTRRTYPNNSTRVRMIKRVNAAFLIKMLNICGLFYDLPTGRPTNRILIPFPNLPNLVLPRTRAPSHAITHSKRYTFSSSLDNHKMYSNLSSPPKISFSNQGKCRLHAKKQCRRVDKISSLFYIGEPVVPGTHIHISFYLN